MAIIKINMDAESSGGGTGDVTSVNGQKGNVILNSENIPSVPFATISSNTIQSTVEEIYNQMAKINDSTSTITSTYSSQKIDVLLSNKANKSEINNLFFYVTSEF